MPDFKKAQSQPIVVVASFFATSYPPTEGEKHVLKIVQWTILVFRGEPTTRYSLAVTELAAVLLTASEKGVAGFQSK